MTGSELSRTPTIGVFDSGFGGLTVLRALIDAFPRPASPSSATPHACPTAPSPAAHRPLRRQSAQFLVNEQGAEYLVIACNTPAPSPSTPFRRRPGSVSVIGVIEPGAQAARNASKTGDVLVIATDATVQSHAYSAACCALGLRAHEKPAAARAPGRGGLGPSLVTGEVVRIYLDELYAEAAIQGLNPDTLVLGCTHYPLLKPLIEKLIPPAPKSSTRQSRRRQAPAASLPRPRRAPRPASANPVLRCFATDSVEKFERLGSRFLGQPTAR